MSNPLINIVNKDIFDNSTNIIDNSSNILIKAKNNQIFKYMVDIKIIKNLFNNIKKYNNNYKNNIILNNIIYKKLKYNNFINDFINSIEKYYYKPKLFYIKRNISYKNFLTIIRQLCNLYNIKFENKIKYSKSKYEIYYIFNIHPIKDACK